MAAGSLIGSPLVSASMRSVSEKDVSKSGPDQVQGWTINSQHWSEQWKRLHPVKTAECVSERIGAPVSTVKKWLKGEVKPSLDYVGPILNRYGLAFIVGAMASPLPWLDDLAREEETRALEAKREALDAKLAEAWARRRGP